MWNPGISQQLPPFQSWVRRRSSLTTLDNVVLYPTQCYLSLSAWVFSKVLTPFLLEVIHCLFILPIIFLSHPCINSKKSGNVVSFVHCSSSFAQNNATEIEIFWCPYLTDAFTVFSPETEPDQGPVIHWKLLTASNGMTSPTPLLSETVHEASRLTVCMYAYLIHFTSQVSQNKTRYNWNIF